MSLLPYTLLEEIKLAQQKDKICETVARYCLTDWPAKHRLRPDIAGDLLMKGESMVIPLSLRGEIMSKLQGISVVARYLSSDQIFC